MQADLLARADAMEQAIGSTLAGLHRGERRAAGLEAERALAYAVSDFRANASAR